MNKFLQFAAEIGFMAGLAAIAFGCWLAWRPAGFMVGGLLVGACAFFARYEMGRK